ncbi:MAG TPA: hypothetical protein VGB46_03115 [Flavisolibacter sp.]
MIRIKNQRLLLFTSQTHDDIERIHVDNLDHADVSFQVIPQALDVDCKGIISLFTISDGWVKQLVVSKERTVKVEGSEHKEDEERAMTVRFAKAELHLPHSARRYMAEVSVHDSIPFSNITRTNMVRIDDVPSVNPNPPRRPDQALPPNSVNPPTEV